MFGLLEFNKSCGKFSLIQYPTKALAPLMLEDYRKVMVDRRGEEEQFSSEHIAECMKKGTTFIYNNFILLHHCIIYTRFA